MRLWLNIFIIGLFTTLLAGCQSTYYSIWETLGKEKRHLLRDQVEKARDDQEKASEQFESVLEKIKDIYGFDGGDLEKLYSKLNSDYEKCEDRAATVQDRIERVDQIAGDLFKEWEKEINEINNAKLRSKSKNSLQDAKERYKRLHNAMVKAESSMLPVLVNLRDYVLFLKHNLNAQAIGSLKNEVDSIESEVENLIRDMTVSINEAESFLKDFK